MKVGDMTLNYYEQYGGYAVEDYFGSSTSVKIPDTVTTEDGLVVPVTRISSYGLQARQGKAPLEVVELGNNVISIGKSAFEGTNLKELYVGKYLQEVDPEAFSGCPYVGIQERGLLFIPSHEAEHCVLYAGEYNEWEYDFPSDCHAVLSSSLSGIDFGDTLNLSNLYYVGDNAFSNCSAETVHFGNNLAGIGNNAFSNSDIDSFLFAETGNCKFVGESAFYGCSATALELPSSIENLGKNCLESMPNLRILSLPFVGPNESTPDYNHLGLSFYSYSILDSLTIDRGIVPYSAFMDLTIHNLTLNHVSAVYSDAFRGCTLDQTLELGDKLETVERNGFYGFECEEIYIPLSIKTLQSAAFWTSASTVINIPWTEYTFADDWYNRNGNTVINWGKTRDSKEEHIPFEGFEYYSSGDYFYITKYIGNDTNVTIPSTVGDKLFGGVQANAFADANAARIKSITMPEGEIQDHAFRNCSAIETIHIKVFQGYKGVEAAWKWFESSAKTGFYQDKSTVFGFYNTIYVDGYIPQSLTSLKFSVEEGANARINIGEAAFYGFSSLRSLEIDGNFYLDSLCFAGCPNLKGDIYIYDETELFSGCFGNAKIRLYFQSARQVEIKFVDYRDHMSICFDLSMVIAADVGDTVYHDGITKFSYRDDLRNPGSVVIVGYEGTSAALDVPSSINGMPVSRIAAFAFENATGLSSIAIPQDIELESKCFSNLSNLSNLSLHSFPSIYDYAGEAKQYDDGIKYNPLGYAFTYSDNNTLPGYYRDPNTRYFIPNALSTISIANGDLPYCALSGYSKLTRVFLPSNCTSIGAKAFENCTGLTDIWIPSSCTSFGDYCFRYDANTIVYKEASDNNLGYGNNEVKEKMKTGYTYEQYCQEVGIAA